MNSKRNRVKGQFIPGNRITVRILTTKSEGQKAEIHPGDKTGLKIFSLVSLIWLFVLCIESSANEGDLISGGHLVGLESTAYATKIHDESLIANRSLMQLASLYSWIERSDVIREIGNASMYCLTEPGAGLSMKVQSQAEGYAISSETKGSKASLNGLYYTEEDHLADLGVLFAGISVKKPGSYTVEGSLYDMVTGDVITVSSSSQLSLGARFIKLYLVGMKSPGPYRIKVLVLYDEYGDEIDRTTNSYTTKAFNDLDLIGPKAMLDGNYSDYGSNKNPDGLYGYLTVDVGVKVLEPGNYSMMASLCNANKKEIVWSVSYANFSSGYNVMHMDFDGKTIERQRVNGPYYLNNVSLFKESPGNASLSGHVVDDMTLQDIKDESYITKSYNYSWFEDPSWPRKILSGSGSGEVLLTISIWEIVPVFMGRYNLDIVGVNMPPITSNWNLSTPNEGYAFHMPGVYMPEKPNDFTVKANGVKDLSIGVKQDRNDMSQMSGTIQNRAWVSSRVNAGKEGIATIQSNFISPGRYQFKVFGNAAENATQVALDMKVVKKLVINGRFNLSLNMSGFPAGNYSFKAKALNGSLALDEIDFEDSG